MNDRFLAGERRVLAGERKKPVRKGVFLLAVFSTLGIIIVRKK
jgi:hypothetical protein